MSDQNYAVFGLNFGNEGKGAVINYLAHKHNQDIIHGVKFAGGVQSSQTVKLKNGISHEFRHFSSGTFAGARTIITKQFVCHPTIFRQEREELLAKGTLLFHPFIDKGCRLSTPYDVVISQCHILSRKSQGQIMYGSGLGHWETIFRNARCRFNYENLRYYSSRSELREWILNIRNTHAKGLYNSFLPDEYKEYFFAESTLNNYVDDLLYMRENSIPLNEYSYIESAKTVIYESPLGLGLNSGSGAYDPYGRNSPHIQLNSSEIRDLIHRSNKSFYSNNWKTIFVTRPYMTRLLTEKDLDVPFSATKMKKEEISSSIKDSLPTFNQFLKVMEFAPISIREIRRRLDLTAIGEKSFAITCLDEFSEHAIPIKNNKVRYLTPSKFISTLSGQFSMPIALRGYGPCKEDISES